MNMSSPHRQKVSFVYNDRSGKEVLCVMDFLNFICAKELNESEMYTAINLSTSV